MWPLKSLHDIVTLLQEQNALTRELIVALTKQQPQTIPSPISVSAAIHPRPRPKLSREYTSKDVTVVTAEMREQQAIALFEKTERPWRIQDLPPEAQAAAIASLLSEDDSDMNRPLQQTWAQPTIAEITKRMLER